MDRKSRPASPGLHGRLSAENRTPILLGLLRALTAASNGEWGVWKNADDGIAGRGDLDFAAPGDAWSVIEEIFTGWAISSGLGPVSSCRHLPHSLFLIAVDPAAGDFVQLDVKDRAAIRGATVFRAQDLVPLLETDPRGFMRLRAGAEGLYKLILNGLGRAGSERQEAMRKERVRELLRRDPHGAKAAAGSLGASRSAALELARRAAEGGWAPAAALRLASALILRGLANPRTLPERRATRRAKATCPVLVAGIRHRRTVPESLETWIARVSDSHPIYR
jgi:hypothetical protein